MRFGGGARALVSLAAAAALLATLTACEPEVPPPFPEPNPGTWDADDGKWQEAGSAISIDDYAPSRHLLTAVVADSLVDGHDDRWLDADTVTSQGEPVLPLVADGPLWVYSVSGSVLSQANPLFPIDKVLGLDEHPDRLVIAQGTNNAWSYYHDGWTAADEDRFDEVVADAGDGVPCIVIVTLGYKASGALALPAVDQGHFEQASYWMGLRATTDPRFVLADWNSLSVPHPEWFTDNVHLNDVGSDQYEALITRALRQCPNPVACPTPTPTVSGKLIDAAYLDFLHLEDVAPADMTYWKASLASTGYCNPLLLSQLTKDDGFSTEVIDAQYDLLMGRDAYPGDLTFWRAGVENQSTTVADLAQGLMASTDFFALAGGTNAGFVDRVYDKTLGRSPSPAESTYWADRIPTSSRGVVGRAILQSAEGRDRRAQALADRYLQHPLDAMHLEYWRAVLGANGGNDVAVAIAMAELPEYRTAAQTR